jgi:hypothetical protein
MGAFIGFILIFLFQILSFAAPALLAAWLFNLVLSIPFDQALWLSLGAIVALFYILQNMTDIPGQIEGPSLTLAIVTVATTLILLIFSGFLGWLLLVVLAVDLTAFEATLLFAISLIAGFFFLARSGTGGLPKWLWLSEADLEDNYVESDIVVSPPKKRTRRNKSGKRWTN